MTQPLRIIFTLWLLSLLFSCGYLIQPKLSHGIAQMHAGAYALDIEHTNIIFKVDHMGLSFLVGRFNLAQASLDFDSSNLNANNINENSMANSKLSAIIDIASLDLANKNLQKTLLASDWFDVEKYPQASFVTRSVAVIDKTHADFTGDFNFHGVTKPLVLHVEFRGAGDSLLTGKYTLGFSAHARLKRSDFGMDYLVPAIGDDVDIDVFAEFQKK